MSKYPILTNASRSTFTQHQPVVYISIILWVLGLILMPLSDVPHTTIGYSCGFLFLQLDLWPPAAPTNRYRQGGRQLTTTRGSQTAQAAAKICLAGLGKRGSQPPLPAGRTLSSATPRAAGCRRRPYCAAILAQIRAVHRGLIPRLPNPAITAVPNRPNGDHSGSVWCGVACGPAATWACFFRGPRATRKPSLQ